MISKKEQGAAQDSQHSRSPMGNPNPPAISKGSQGIRVVKGQLNGLETYAIPDTGAEFNMMAADFAKTGGFVVDDKDPNRCRLLRMANGKHIKTIGIVNVEWGFISDPSQVWQLTFHVLADFVYDLILGSQFLFATQTMSHHKGRLSMIPRPLQSPPVLRVHLLGSASKLVRGSLHGEIINALPDSGSEPSLLSYEYIKRRGWLSMMEMRDQNLVQFADGSVEKTEGSLSARWVFLPKIDTDSNPESWKVKFHVLRGCSHNVILGQDVLDESDAFFKHADAFLDMGSRTEAPGLNLVIWLPKKKKKSEAPPSHQSLVEGNTPARLNVDIHTELQRRAEANRRINRMPSGAGKEAAIEIEEQRRRVYDYSNEFQGQSSSPSSSGSTSRPPISMRISGVRPVRSDPLYHYPSTSNPTSGHN